MGRPLTLERYENVEPRPLPGQWAAAGQRAIV